MGCNCGKKTRPLGMKPKPDNSKDNKNTGKTQSFVLDMGNGRTQSFNSELEAAAYKARNGNRGFIRPA